jgi:VIT1/CCC1 family predicted Fe2+/Mn2+ transporter
MKISSLLGRLRASLATSAGEVVFGMEDGTVSIFGLVFGVAATTNQSSTVLIAGASGAVAAAVSMMAGAYLEAETSRDVAQSSAALIDSQMQRNPAEVREKVMDRIRAVGIGPDQAETLNSFLRSEPAVLKGVASALAASAVPGLTRSPLVQSLWMLVADFLAAAIPIVPFALMPVPAGRVVSGTVTLLLLVGLGIGRARIGGRDILRTVIETVSIGVAAALAGVAIGVAIARIFGV